MGVTNSIQQMLCQEAAKRRKAITVNLELLPVCNLDCKMCYIRTDMEETKKQGGIKRKEEWLALAKELRAEGTLFLLLTGGEVFLYPEFRQLYEELYRMGFIITINTNATLIDEKTVLWLSQLPPKCVSISLYGISDDTYESLCGKKGMFSRVDRAARLLLEKGIRIEFKMVQTPDNVHDTDKCYEYSQSLGVHFEASAYAFPAARKIDGKKQVRFSPVDAVYYKLMNRRRETSLEGFLSGIYEHLNRFEETREIPGGDVYGFTCGATNSTCWITWKGHMTPCAMLETPYTLPFKDGFLAAWEELKIKCDRILMSPKCSHCEKREVCTVCPAANYAEMGCFEKASTYHCQMTDLTLESMQRLVTEYQLKQNEKD